MATYRVVERTHTFRDQFERLKELTGHRCTFCEDFSELMTNRMYRIMHNLTSVLDTIDLVRSGEYSHEDILRIIGLASPTYLRYYEVM